MNIVIGPTYSIEKAFEGVFDAYATVLDTPIVSVALAQTILGEPVLFEEGADPHDIAVTIPNLPGLDEIELASASFNIASAPYERVQSVNGGSGTVNDRNIILSGVAEGQTVMLTGITLKGLTVRPPDSGTVFGLTGSDGAAYWRQDGDGAVSSDTPPTGTLHQLHVLVRPITGANAGPPLAAVPYFKMPGAGGSMYGPALGGASMTVARKSNGDVDAVITLNPPQPMTGCKIVIGTTQSSQLHDGLPTELATTPWSFELGEARFDARAQAISVTTHAGATPADDGAVVADFANDPGASLRSVDFAPAARVALGQGYPTATGTDLGLTLRVTTGVPGALYLSLGSIAARYVQRPLAVPASLSLLGAPERVEVPLPAGLRPKGLSFRVDGVYGPNRLTADADAAPPGPREGYRIAASSSAARRMLLNTKEQTLPLTRLAVYGRASEDGELLLTRHGGDEMRIGPALGAPLSLPIQASDTPQWHRVDIPAKDRLSQHKPAFWMTLKATKGVFWWFAEPQSLVPGTQYSADGGSTWAASDGRPFAQAWVEELDPETKEPAPLLPLSLGWTGGILNADIVGVGAGPLSADFTRLWVAEGSASDALFNGIAALDGPLMLSLECRRDVDLSLSEVVLTYDPWSAKGVAP